VVHNASDENAVKSKEQKEKNERAQELEDIKLLIETAPGLRFFKRLIVEGRVFQTTFTGNSQTFFLEGHRNLALKFFSDIADAAPHKVAELMINKETED